MPELLVTKNDGQLSDDALAVVLSTMHFPSADDGEKRKALADLYRAQKLLTNVAFDDPEEEPTVSLTAPQIALLRRGRTISELVPDLNIHLRNGFIAGHWMTFRIFASREYPVLNSTNRWLDYASAFLLPELPSDGFKWPIDPKQIGIIQREYGPAAHLWAAATYNQSFRRNLLSRGRIDWLPKVAWSIISGHKAHSLMSLAKGFLDAAIEGKLFKNRRSGLQLEDVWTLPSFIEPSTVVVDHPDHLLEMDFQDLKAGYVKRSHATAETRIERREQAEAIARLVQLSEKKPEPIEVGSLVKPPLIKKPIPPNRIR